MAAKRRKTPAGDAQRDSQPGARVRARTPNFPGAEYQANELEFFRAVDRYKRERRRPFPTLSELLAIFFSLGYRQVESAGPLPPYPLPASSG